MEVILEWPPVLWLVRAIAVLVLAGVFVLAAALLLRIMRPPIFWTLVTGDLPIRSIKSKLKIFGQEFEANIHLDSQRDKRLVALERRLVNLLDLIAEQGRRSRDFPAANREAL